MASTMTSLSFDLTSRKEVDISDLQAQNKALQSELTQCQADKEFVWSLWKRLQVSNPDVTEAISLVIQREKEKAEAKDLKVLEILQIKDDRIEELQNIVAKQTQEIGDLLSKKVDLQDNSGRLQLELDTMREKLSSSQLQIQQLENRERSISDIQRQTMESSERDKYGLQRKVGELSSELDVVKAENREIISQKHDMENKIRTLEREISGKVSKFDDLVKDFEDAKTRICLLESESQQQQRENSYKSRELKTVRKELAELWTSHNQLTEHSSQQTQLIRQLQSLHNDTQRMMKNQEDAFSMESISIQQMYADLSCRYETLKKTESDLRHQVVALRKEVLEKDDVISQLQGPVPDNKYNGLGGSFLDLQHEAEPVVDYEYKIKNLQGEVKSLKKKLLEKEKVMSHFEQLDADQSVVFDVNRLNCHERTHSTPSRVLTSPKLSPRLTPRDARGSTREGQGVALKRRLADCEHLLDLKSRELSELHKAHAKRLDRVKSLQHNYRLVKEQLKILEDEQGRKKKRARRPDPRDLQRENSDAVWNELAHFKNENKSLQLERLSMQEELDTLRVEIAQNAATVYELRVKLEQEREEFEYQLRHKEVDNKVKNDIESEITILKSSVQSKDISLQKVDRTLREVVREKETVSEENRKLRSETLHLQQELAQYRIQMADLTRDVQRCKREINERSRAGQCVDHLTSTRHGRKACRLDTSLSESAVDLQRSGLTNRHPGYRTQRRNRSHLARKYQAALNRSIEKMSCVFDHFNEDGWEEVTDTPPTEEDTEVTESDTLGQTIVSVSRQHDSTNTTNVASSVVQPASKQQLKVKRNQPRRRWVPRTSSTKQEKSSSSETLPRSMPKVEVKIFRDMGTSPIPFGSPVKDKPKKAAIPPVRQIGPLKQRVAYLQQQLITLRSSRANALKSLSEQKEVNQQQNNDLNQANQRIRLAKVTIQKLSADVERYQKEKLELEQRLASRDELSSTASTLQDKHNDQEWKVLEARLKVASCEVSRQSSTIRNLKTENESLQDQIRSLQDRLNHMERDNNQKRTLVENHRVKLKQLQESAKSDANILSDLETKVKLLTDNNDKLKVQIESLKKRLSVVTKEKKEYEEQCQKISADLEKKSTQLAEHRTKCSELQGAISDLERTTKEQLQGLVSQSELAIEAAHSKLVELQGRTQQYEQFVKMLGNELVRSVQHARDQLKHTLARKQREATPVHSSLQRAQSVAQNILDLSQSDIDDIMSADGDRDDEMDSASEMEKKNDKKWAKKCEKLLSSKDFVASLVKHFLQKIDERDTLAAAVNA